MSEFKEGDIVAVISNSGLQNKKILPNGLISYLFYYYVSDNSSIDRLSVKALGGDSYTIYSETYKTRKRAGPLIRKATPRESFLYHINNEPFIMEE